jgi:hypothetical protein
MLRASTLAFALALQGCGDSGGVSSTPTPTPTTVFDTSEYRRSTGPSQQNTIPAWQLGATGAGVTLAIIDSGIDTTNPEFAGRIAASSADVAGSRGLINADSSHGTQVALTAAAARDGTGIVGIAYGATIQMLRVDDPGSCAKPDGCSFFDSKIAAGIDAAVAGGAKVINLSLGGSPPNQAVVNAVGRAAAAGVVIVVSAGNDGVSSTTNPDTFAVGLRAAGNGNVIIAGSVGDTNTISSFSNEAGTEQQWYLMARGERVCCVYENGAIKVAVTNGQNFVTVVSGTSFSAPQITGAVALLRQHFPNLTAVQVVDLLLRTATDLGTAGTDTIYGRGLMNIGAAFAPQGSASLAGNSSALVSLSGGSLITSAAMGDAVKRSALQAVILDACNRAYTVDLGLKSAQISPRLTSALMGRGHVAAGDVAGLSLAFSLDRTALGQPLHLSQQDARAARVLAAKVLAHLSPQALMGFTYDMGAEGMVRQMQGQNGPAFMIAADPADDIGFARRGMTALALNYRLGGWGLTAHSESGRVSPGTIEQWTSGPFSAHDHDRYFRFGLAADRHFGPVQASLGAAWLREDRTLLGAQLASGLGGNGANTVFVDASAGVDLGARWRVGASARQGWTRAQSGGTLASGSRFASNGWALDLSRSGLFQKRDSLAFRLSQPLRVSSGGLSLMLPTSYSYETLGTGNSLRRVSLSPKGREIDRELAWRGLLGGGSITASLYLRSDPGHYADVPDDYGLGLSWGVNF